MGLMNIGDQRIAQQPVVDSLRGLREDQRAMYADVLQWRIQMLDQAKEQTRLLEKIAAATDHTARR
jgi:hypothetical protein